MKITQEQFESTVIQYQRLIITICLSFTHNYFDAEDLAQDTFLSAYKNLDRFDGANFKAWLTTIAANKCRDYLKSPARKTIDLTEEDAQCIEDKNDSPAQLAERNASDQKIRMLCDRLKEPYKTVACGYFCDSVKLSEMAENTGQNLKTLQTQLYRAKKILKTLWEEEQYEQSVQ